MVNFPDAEIVEEGIAAGDREMKRRLLGMADAGRLQGFERLSLEPDREFLSDRLHA